MSSTETAFTSAERKELDDYEEISNALALTTEPLLASYCLVSRSFLRAVEQLEMLCQEDEQAAEGPAQAVLDYYGELVPLLALSCASVPGYHRLAAKGEELYRHHFRQGVASEEWERAEAGAKVAARFLDLVKKETTELAVSSWASLNRSIPPKLRRRLEWELWADLEVLKSCRDWPNIIDPWEFPRKLTRSTHERVDLIHKKFDYIYRIYDWLRVEMGGMKQDQKTTPSLGSSSVPHLAEAERAILRATELIDSDPSIVEGLLPAIGELMGRIDASPHVLRRKEVAERLHVTPARVNQLLESGRLPGIQILSQTVYPLKPVEAVEQIERPTGRPPKR